MTDRSITAFLGYFVRAYPGRTSLMVFLLVISGLAEGIGFFSLLPVLEMASGDGLSGAGGLSEFITTTLGSVGVEVTLGTMLVIVVVAIAGKGVFLWLAMRQVGYSVAQVAADLRLRLIRALMGARWSHFVTQPVGFYAASIGEESHRASVAFRQACTALAGVVRIAAYLVLAVLLSWEVALAALVLSGLLLFGLRGFIVMTRQAGLKQTAVMKALLARLTESLPGIKPVKAMAREEHILPFLEQETEDFNRAQQQQVLASESLKAFQEPILIAVLAGGLYLVLTLGEQSFASVLVLTLVFYRLVGTVNQLQTQYQLVVHGESAFWSIMEHIELAESRREESVGNLTAPPLSDGLAFDGVSFRYGDRVILKNTSFRIEAGTFTSFVGPSGSGKTTILDLIVGLHHPFEGRVLVDGVSLGEVNILEWRRQIGYVPQEMVLFRGTIYDNVTLGDSTYSKAQVEEALRDAGAWEFVSAHPHGLDRTVGEGGAALSGGQRQRLAIARALVGSPKLLILDEATTALDPRTEEEICVTLRALSGKVTIVAVSHQLALREAADVVFEVQNYGVRLAEDRRVQSLG